MCEGFVLLEPVHTSFKEIKSKRRGFEGVGWGSDEKVDDSKLHEGDGIIMLTSDPAGLYNSVSDHSEPVKDGLVEYSIVKRSSQMYLMTNLSKTKSPKVSNRLTFRQK